MRLVLALLLALGAGPLQPGPDSSAASTTLDVIVEDPKGRAVETLGPGDFAVTGQNGSLVVEAVRYVRAGADTGNVPAPPINSADDEAAAAADGTGRVIAIFLDEFHVAPGPGADRVREALIRFVKEDVKSSDLLVVLKPLDSLIDIRLTRDRSTAVEAIASFSPRRGDYTPRTPFEQNFIAGAPARIETARAQIVASSLDALATHLGRFSASRKTLIVVSEGFSRTARRRGDELLPSVDSVVMAANRAHVSIYPIEPVASQPSGTASDGATQDGSAEARLRDALRSLADGTSGRAISATDDPAVGLKRALTDASGYYVVTVSGAGTPRDGRFHPVDVTVRRPELTSRARKGYWAPPAETALSTSISPSWAGSFAAKFVRHSSPLIRPWFGMSRGSDGTTRVSFVWEPSPRVPGDRSRQPAPERIALSVTTLEGSPVFNGIVFATNAGSSDPSVARPSRVSFASPAGRLLVQMAIEDGTSRVVDRDVRDLVVEGFAGPLTFGSSEVLRARNAREYQQLAADPDAVPVASREFSRTERLLIRVPVFSTGDSPAVSARLVSGLGGEMRELAVNPVPSRTAQYQIDLPLAALANGLYNIEFTAKTPAGQARDSLSFRVTP